jgi:hypothetical protein
MNHLLDLPVVHKYLVSQGQVTEQLGCFCGQLRQISRSVYLLKFVQSLHTGFCTPIAYAVDRINTRFFKLCTE